MTRKARSGSYHSTDEKKKKGKKKKISKMSSWEAAKEMSALESSGIQSARWEHLCRRAGKDPDKRRKKLVLS